MFSDIFAIIAPVFICASLGFAWDRLGQNLDSEFIGRLVMWVGAPCLIVGTLGKVELSLQVLREIIFAVFLLMLLTGATVFLACKVLALPWRDFAPSLLFSNSGNMGLPISLFAFGEQGLAVALAIFIVLSFTHFTVGVAILAGGSPVGGALRSPIAYAGIVAVLLVVTGWKLPAWLQNSVSMLGDIAIPLMLITLGATLSRINPRYALSSLALGSARLLLGFCAGWIIAELLDLDGLMRGVLIIQSSMPIAVFNYLLAARYDRSPQEVAGAVLASTALSFVTLPALLWFVLPQ